MSRSNISAGTNKTRVIQLIIICVSICAIIGEIIYIIAGGYGKSSKETANTSVIVNNNSKNDSVNDSDNKDSGNADSSRDYKKYVFVGDSRYVGMSSVEKSEEDTYIAKNGIGYSYLEEQMDLIKTSCDADTALIIGLGVNDLKYSRDKYITAINKMAEEMDCQIYYMLVNPVDENKEKANGYSVENAVIDEFNKAMKNELINKVKVIDTNSYLKQQGYTTQDGLHYDNATYKLIYNYIKDNL